jgi:tetratricopeptide (TPR) repeat protein
MAVKELQKEVIDVRTAVIAILGITFIAFLPTFRNGYVFWDDPEYILHNPLMSAPLKFVLFGKSSYYLSNYHPLTILIYTFEHKFFGSTMTGYHAVSLLFHLSNSLLVFLFVYYLLNSPKQMPALQVKANVKNKTANTVVPPKKNVMIPMVTALLFGVHPMHAESVAWASELKDVLYTFFFLASLVCYVMYMQYNRQIKYLGYALILYFFSLISKGQAVTLPLDFLLVDYFLKRKPDMSMITDKFLFFAMSIFFGIIAIKAQDVAIVHPDSGLLNSFFWGFYGLGLYLYKFILPINLSGLYPYPLNADHSMPVFVYFALPVIAALLFVVYQFYRKDKYVMFGVLFFLANIFTVLKFIPVGDAIIADRYSYIPFIGLFFIIGYGFNKLLNNPAYKPNKKVIQYSGMALLVILSSLTFARTTVWKDSYSFWGDAIQKNKNYWRPYYCIGQEYYNNGDYASAIKYYSGGIENDRFCPPTVYMWRGITYLDKTHNTDSAIADFKKVLDFGNKTDPSQYDGRKDLGLAYFRKGMYDDALKIYNELITMAPNDSNNYFQRALVYAYRNPPQPQQALADYNKALEMSPGYVAAYLNRGSLYVDQLGKYDLGIADFDKTLQLEPGNTDALMDKGIAFYRKGSFDESLHIFNSISGGNDNGKINYLKALDYAGKKDYKDALQNAEQAQKMGLKVEEGLMQEWKSKG